MSAEIRSGFPVCVLSARSRVLGACCASPMQNACSKSTKPGVTRLRTTMRNNIKACRHDLPNAQELTEAVHRIEAGNSPA